jgi:mono/diheme cytochrome c family protein
MSALNRAFSRARLRRQSWWLLAVLVLGLLAPGISAALAHARGDFSAWQDICRAPSASSKAAPAQPLEAALDLLAHGHCPACHIGGADGAGPPPVPALLVRDDLVAEVPERFWTAPVTAHAWRPASARAPPELI